MARPRVQNKESFQGSNLFGQWMTKRDQPYSRYVVYSYGYHWPLFVYENGVWYENADKFRLQRPSIDHRYTPMKIRYP